MSDCASLRLLRLPPAGRLVADVARAAGTVASAAVVRTELGPRGASFTTGVASLQRDPGEQVVWLAFGSHHSLQ